MKYCIGDWVRFYQNGRMIIGQVEYIGKDIIGYTKLKTDQGEIRTDAVLELKRNSIND